MTWKYPLFSASLLLGFWSTTPLAHGGVLVDTDFNSGTFASAGLFDYNTVTNPALTAGSGVSSSTGLDFGSDGLSATASVLIDSTTTFSLFGRYNGLAGTASGTLAFGWSKAAVEYNPFSGIGTGVATTDHVIVGLTRIAGNGFSLAAGNGGMNALTSATLFGNTVASLTSGNWYRLEGTVLYNSTTGAFTFNNISLDDFGATGATEVTANLLSGATKTVTAAGFGTTGRAIFATNRDRGFQVTDNYFAATVPEPATFGLAGAGLLVLLGRRRRS